MDLDQQVTNMYKIQANKGSGWVNVIIGGEKSWVDPIKANNKYLNLCDMVEASYIIWWDLRFMKGLKQINHYVAR